MDSQLLRINNEDGTVAQPIHGKAPKGEGNPGAGSGPAVKWSWNGIPFERITSIAKPLKIFTVSHRPKVGRENTKWDHANDRPLLILGQDLLLKPAQSAQGKGEADGVAPFEEAASHTVISPVHDTGQHESVVQTGFGGPAFDTTESAVGAVEGTIVEDVEEAVSTSHRVLSNVMAKDFRSVDDEGPVVIDSGGCEDEADAGDPPAFRLVPQGTESESEGYQFNEGMDEVGYPGPGGTEGEAGTTGAVEGVARDQGEDKKEASVWTGGGKHRNRGRSVWSALKGVAAYLGLVFLLGLHSLFNYHHFSTLDGAEGDARTSGDVDGGAGESSCYRVEDEREQELEKGQGLEEEPEPELVARPWPWLQREHHGGGLLARSRELWRLLNPGMPGTQPGNRGAAQRADSARRARRSHDCSTGRGVSFMAGPEGETGQ